MLQKIAAGIKIIRPVNIIITFISVVVAGIICSEESVNLPVILLAALSASAAAAAGNIINDITDVEIDRINRPGRVLPSGRMSRSEASILYLLLVISALIIAAFVNFAALIIVIISLIIIALYSLKLKAIPLAGNIIVGIMTGAAFIFGGVAAGSWERALIPAGFAFLINFIREIVKDIEDMEGDIKNNVYTFPARYGYRASAVVILSATLLLVFFTLIPFIFAYYTIEYFVAVMLTVNTVFVYFIKLLLNGTGKEKPGKLSLLLKLNMVLGLIAIYLGKD